MKRSIPKKYLNKFRVDSVRLRGYDYGRNGSYFVTICTKNRKEFLGEIVETHDNASLRSVEGESVVETHDNASLPYRNKFGPQSRNLSSIIRGYKGAVKTYATKNNIEFAWQPRFFDRIIRDEKEFESIRNYIKENPKNWSKDKNNEEGLYF